MPAIQEIQKIVELPQVLFMDEVVEMPVVTKGKIVRLGRATARMLAVCYTRTL